MCTLVILRRPEHAWPVIIGANRDEMIDRPAKPPGRHWPDRAEVVAGIDLLAGGTWLGVNDWGVAAAVHKVAGPGREVLGAVRGPAGSGLEVHDRARLRHGLQRADRAAGVGRAASGVPLRRLAPRAIPVAQLSRVARRLSSRGCYYIN